MRSQTEVSFPLLYSATLQNLKAPMENEEIKHALFKMYPWKAPRPYGFPAGFIKKHGELLARKFVNLYVMFDLILVIFFQ
jgi:hypothetical protein